jgi:hypothetical protein
LLAASVNCKRRDRPMERNPPSLPMLRMLLLLPMLKIDAKLPMLRSEAALAIESTLEALSTLHTLLWLKERILRMDFMARPSDSRR